MLLAALNRYAQSSTTVPPPGYASKALGFRLVIDKDLAGCRLEWLYRPASGEARAPLRADNELVPNIKRSGTKPPPMLGCDNASYVLGRAKRAKDEAGQLKEDSKAAEKKTLFDGLLREYAESTGDEAAERFLCWRAAGEPGLAAEIDALSEAQLKRLDVDLIAIGIEGRSGALHSSPTARAFWAERALGAKSSGVVGVCLSCGQHRALVDTIPQSLQGALIPEATQADVALLSANFPAASRGASGIGLKSAPVCVECASGAVAAFNELAASEDHRWGHRSESRATIWWTRDDRIDFLALNRPSSEIVKSFLEALEAPSSRVGLTESEMDRFYALTFSGNVARLVVRQWIDVPLVEAHRNVAAWFDDTKGPDPERPYASLIEMANCAGPLVRRDKRWHQEAPEGARDVLLRCALVRGRLPISLLVTALSRARAEIGYLADDDPFTARLARSRMRARFALIRLILNRNFYQEDKVSQHLDEECMDPPYLSGRIFAIRESLQRQSALASDSRDDDAKPRRVNASITDRFFALASLHPRSVEPALARLQQQHLRALQRKDREGAAAAIGSRLGTLLAAMGPAPQRMKLDQQALWLAGYYQQQQHDIQTTREHKKAAAEAKGEV